MINKWLLGLVLLFATLCLQGQRYSYNQFTALEGLPSNAVRSSLIDSRNWFWVGTDAGVARYQDGSFVSDPRLDTLNGMRVWAIAEDNENKLWFGTYGHGLACFSGDSLKWYNKKNSALADDFIRILKFLPEHKQLLIGGSNIFAVMTENSIQHYEITAKINPFHVVDFMLNKGEYYILMGERDRFVSYNPESRKIQYIQHSFNSKYRLWAGIVTRNNETYFGIDRDRYAYKSAEKEFVQEGLGQVFEWLEDPEGDVWAAAWKAEGPGGLFRFRNGEMTDFTKLLGLENVNGWGLEYDSTNSCLWFLTLNMGLIQIPKTNFEYYELPDYIPSDESIKAIQSDLEGTIWICTETNLLKYSNGSYHKMKEGEFIEVFLNYIKSNFSELFNFIKTTSDRLIESRLNQFKNDNYDLYLLSYLNNLLNLNMTEKTKGSEALYNQIWKDIAQYDLKNYVGNPAIKFYAIQIINKNNLIIASSLGLFDYNIENNKLIYSLSKSFDYQNLNLTEDSLILQTGSFIKFIIRSQYKAGKLLSLPKLSIENTPELPQNIFILNTVGNRHWYGTLYTGLYSSIGNEYTHLNKQYPKLPQQISAIALADDSLAIVGGNNGKVYIFSNNAEKPLLLKTIGAQDGLKAKTIMWMQNDGQGFLWVSTNEALYRIALNSILKPTINIEVYDRNDGYKAYKYYKSTTDLDGNIWTEADHALLKINTNPADQLPPDKIKVELRQIDLFHKPVEWNKLTNTNAWTQLPQNPVFNHDQNYFTFHFISNNRINPQQDYYSYRLLGLDTSWSVASTEKRAIFTNLDPGNYTFELRLHKPINITRHTLSYPFNILKPWWQQWWFIVLVLAAFIALLYTAMSWRFRFLREQQKRKYMVQQQLTELKLKALQAQMNPHFVFNVLTAIQNAILKNEIDNAINYLADVSRLIRRTLDYASEKYISLEDEIEYVENYLRLEKIRMNSRLRTTIEIDSKLDPQTAMIPPMLLQPLIENAIKHGLNKKEDTVDILIRFEKINDTKYHCIVEDKGEGISLKTNSSHISRGLDMIYTRIQLLNEEFGEQAFAFIISNKVKPETGARMVVEMRI
ncbi:MAG: histidine kinase [Bacteroidales bacterium]|nr:histidine kinase [Bacteroidales bacterium]